MENKNYKEILRKCYFEILNRAPDEVGFNHFLSQIENHQINVDDLPKIFKDSYEYKFSHPTESDNLSTEQRMKADWNARALIDTKFSIRSVLSQSENDFWQSGIVDCNFILGKGLSRYQKIILDKNPMKLRVLEIGCGIGRILIPMSKIFGEVTGVDVSSKMVELAKKNTHDISHCIVYENNGSELTMLSNDYFDFCYSFLVFQHVPEKRIVQNYMHEVSRTLKSGGIFRFQVRGKIGYKPTKITTWDGAQFSVSEMHNLVDSNKFEILEESGQNCEYYWFTLKSIK